MALRLDKKQTPAADWLGTLRTRFPTEDYVDRALTRKLGVRPGPPHKPQTAEGVVGLLQAFLAKRLKGAFTLSDVKALTGGSSKEQFSFRLQWTDAGAAKDQRFVLRLQPSESIVETHRQREFDVMRALKGAIPVPDVHWVDPEGEEFGYPALISAFCEGVARPPAEGLITGATGNYGPRYRALLGPQFVQLLADIGRFDWRKANIPSLDIPREGTNEAVIWAINWWQRVWEEDCLEPVPFMTLAAEWLRENAPPVDHLSLVHADYKGGNFLFLPDTGEITSILDWELVHLGDRHEDLALILDPLYCERADDGELLIAGLLRRDEYLREYEKRSGLPVDPKRLTYYEIFTSWRSAVIALGTAPRCALGQKTHFDSLLLWSATCAPPLMATVHKYLRDKI